MSDLISRDAAIVALANNRCGNDEWDLAVTHDVETIKKLPSVDPKKLMLSDPELQRKFNYLMYKSDEAFAEHGEWATGVYYTLGELGFVDGWVEDREYESYNQQPVGELKSCGLSNLIKWIPCETQLPEYDQRVILYFSTGSIEVGKLFRLKTYDGNDYRLLWEDERLQRLTSLESVVAWMPIPAPYKGDAE